MGVESESLIQGFENYLSSLNYSVGTRNNYLYVVKGFLNYMRERELTAENINAYLVKHYESYYNTMVWRSAILKFLTWQKKKDIAVELLKLKHKGLKHVESDVTYEQIKQLFGCFDNQQCEDVFTIQALSGCRQIEAWFIERKNVHVRQGYVLILVRQKGGRNETIVINDVERIRTIFSRSQYRGLKYPFLNPECQHLSFTELLEKHYGNIRKRYARAWSKACKKAGIPQYRSHDARRAVGRKVYDTHGIHGAKKVLRHKSIMMTDRYIEGRKIDIVKILKDL